jgi:hypothetical protein
VTNNGLLPHALNQAALIAEVPMQILVIQSASTHALQGVGQRTHRGDKFPNRLLDDSPSIVVIQLPQALPVTFKGVEAPGAWVVFVIPDQVALKGRGITLSEQLLGVLSQDGTVTKARSQKTNQL